MKSLPLLALALWLAFPTTSPGGMQFTNSTSSAGINCTFSYSSVTGQFWNIEDAFSTGGAVAEDFNGDGWIDLYVLGGGDSPNRLYINQHDGTFIDEAAEYGLDLTGPFTGVCAADVVGNGFIDIFLTSATGTNILLLNDGSGHFTVGQVIVTAPGASSPSFGDIDNDGLLDLAFGEWTVQGAGNLKIYHNTGGGHFQLQQTLPTPWVYTPRFADLDGDGFQDLLVAADFGNAAWYRNAGNGLFVPGGTFDVQNGMGAAVGDVNNDGNNDVFISGIRDFGIPDANWGTSGNRLLINNGSGGFTDTTTAAGVRDGFWGWGCDFADFDNDGSLDLFEVNGWPEPATTNEFAKFCNQPARLYHNLGNGQFEEVAAASGAADNMSQGRSVVVFDYDNDGREDVFVMNNSVVTNVDGTYSLLPGPPVLLHNVTTNGNAWLDVHLAGLGAPHHSQGIGARVYLTAGGGQQMRELNASSGFGGHGPGRIAHFGMGTNASADVVRAIWTNGDKTELHNVAAGQSITLNSPQATVSQRLISPGQPVTAAIAATNLPAGASASWSVDGKTNINPDTVTLTSPGTHELVLTIFGGGSPAQFLRSETLEVTVTNPAGSQMSIARQWNEQNLSAIRIDLPNPPKHARALFYTSVAMWDAWAAYDTQAAGYLHHETASAADTETARGEAISYAAFRVLSQLYSTSASSNTTELSLNTLMTTLGFDPANTATNGDTPAALGNRVAQDVLLYAANDGSGSLAGFLGASYAPVNDPMPVYASGTVLNDSNRWQPLQFTNAVTQNGLTTTLIQTFVGSQWGGVRPFGLTARDDHNLYIEPVPPPGLGGATDAAFKQGVLEVVTRSSQLDPTNGLLMDISPGTRGNNSLGLNDGSGHPLNPVTGLPYATNIVNQADFGRVIAEYWADGPTSETPPGHWNLLANKVSDTPGFSHKIGGSGPEVNRLEWDVKLYLAINGALHDAAVAAWGCKRIYDTVRPVSSIRYMGEHGQSSDPTSPAYISLGLPLVTNVIELVTAESSAPGQRHAQLSGHIGEIAVHTWAAGTPGFPGGVKWILAADWLPYQRSTFVTPAFPGYVSGHSAFSRAAAEVLVRITGSAYFPGGLGSFTASSNQFLQFDIGPSTDVTLQWATYYDASDQAGQSRIYGGIHYPADDSAGRIMGSQCGIGAWNLATHYFDGSIANIPFAVRFQPAPSGAFNLNWDATRGAYYKVQQADDLLTGIFTDLGDWIWAGETLETLQLPAPPTPSSQKFYRVIRAYNH